MMGLMRPVLYTLAWASISGCWLSETEVTERINVGRDSESDSDTEDLRLLSVNPDQGTTEGDDVIILSLSHDVDSVSVQFGSEDAEVLTVEGSIISVRTPPQAAEGFVDVSISANGGNDSLDDSFYYWEDSTDLTGAIGMVAWYHYQGVGWPSDIEDDGQAYFRFVHPTDLTLYDRYSPELNDCASGWSATFDPYPVEAPAPRLVSDNGDSITLSPNGAYFYSENLNWDAGATFSLTREETAPWPELSLDDAIEWPNEVYIDYPLVDLFLDYVDPETYIEWSGSSSNPAILRLSRYEGDEVVETVTCVVTDDGSYTLDGGVWEDWTPEEYLVMEVGRVIPPDATLPFNHGNVEIAGVYFSAGVAITQ